MKHSLTWSLVSGHRNFVNGCKFFQNQQGSLLSGEFDEQAVTPQGELTGSRVCPPALRSGGPRREVLALSVHVASWLPAAFMEVDKTRRKWAESSVVQLGRDDRALDRRDSSPHTGECVTP